VYLEFPVFKQVGGFGCREDGWSHQPQGRCDLFCYCDFYAGYDALWEQETPHERVEQFGTRVMRHERPWTRQHWINAA
jgi:hypothetical protein